MNSDMINSMNSVNSGSVNSITVNSKNSNLGIFTLATPCTHIKIIKLELQKLLLLKFEKVIDNK
jgi:hypothetical protein